MNSSLPRRSLLLLPSMLLCLLLSAAPLRAQAPARETWARVGVFGGVNVNIHSAAFAELTGVPNCCPEFESGSGVGGAFGLIYVQMLGGPLELDLRAGIEGRGATLEASEPLPVVVDGELYDGEVLHVIESGLTQLLLEPTLGIRAGDVVHFYLGPRIGIPTSTTFAQREELAKPADIGTFENGTRVRNDTSGALPSAAGFDAGLSVGVSFDIPLAADRSMIASPEAFFTADLTNVTTDQIWKSHALRFGVTLTYALTREAPAASVAVTPAPAETPSLAGAASIRALSVAPDGAERSDVRVNVEEFISTNMRPLLNYVFFEEGSAELPQRYERADPRTFDVNRLHSLDAIETYHHLLDIVGQRLVAHPRAHVTLVGTTTLNGSDTGLALARARAATVRDFLRRAWAIDDARIGVDARALPARPSDTTSADGRAENRRVEIVVDDPDVLAPVVTADTLRSVTPPIIRFRPAVTGAIDAASWRIAATQRDATLTSFEGAGPLPDSLDWDTNADQLAVPDASDSLRYALRVVDRAGKEVVARGALPVEVVTLQRKREERVGDRVIDRYSLILFDYDRSDLDAANARIAQEIGRHITPQATVTVSGHTDRMGDEAHNQRLSEDRARSLATALGIAPERASGDGEHPLLYDNDLPEGRFYSRTVTVIVETPR